LLVSQIAGRENALKKIFSEQLTLPDPVWRNLTLGWAAGFFLAGVLNLVVAYNFSLEFWVSYKLIGGISITLIYSIITVIYLAWGGHLQEETKEQDSTDAADANH
ncbi:MAG TPA: septation protein IspZ, partial [Pseudomonadales bacterium]|nr:septation protein IspZ [Pseudomonadales bacterium]